jgi:hypothetical protein
VKTIGFASKRSYWCVQQAWLVGLIAVEAAATKSSRPLRSGISISASLSMKMKNLIKVICVVFNACSFKCRFMNENEKSDSVICFCFHARPFNCKWRFMNFNFVVVLTEVCSQRME